MRHLKVIVQGIFILLAMGAIGLQASPTQDQTSAYHYYMRALLYESQGNLISAQTELAKAIALEPDSAHLFRMDAEISFYLGQVIRSKKSIDRANKLDPDNTKGFILAGQIYWSLGEIEIAEQRLRRAVELSPDESEPLVSLATALTTRDPNKAIQLYQDFLKTHPAEVEIRERLAQLYRSQGELDKAKKEWEKTLEGYSNSVRAHLALAQIAEVHHDTMTAISHYEAVLEKDPGNLPLLLRVGELRYRNNEMMEASEAFNKAKKIAPESASANFWMALLHEHRAEWKEASVYLEKVAEKSAEPGVLLRLSHYYSQSDQMEKAIRLLKNLSESEPENTDFLNYLAIAYEEVKKYREASEIVKKLLEIDPDNAEYQFYLATFYDRLKKFPLAVVALRKAIELKPDYLTAMNYLGYSYADRNENLEEAEKLLLKVVKINPENSAYLDSLGWVYYRMGKYKLAVDYLRQATITGRDSLIWDHLGDVYNAKKDYPQAVLAWDESIRIVSNQKKVRKKISKVIKSLSDSEKLNLFVKRNAAIYADLKSMKGLIQIEVCHKRACVDNPGQIDFEQSGYLKIEIPGPLSGPLLLALKPHGKPVQYGALHPAFQTAESEVIRAMNRMEYIFSGQIFRMLDMTSLDRNVRKSRGSIVANGEDQSISFALSNGLINKITWKDENSQDQFILSGYDDSQWPNIPYLIEWRNLETKFGFILTLKQPVITPVYKKNNEYTEP